MSATNLTKSTILPSGFDAAVQATRTVLAEQGFGILTEIDVQATLKKKLGVDYPPTLILGACNPKLAHRALMAEPDVAALMPCNVVVREKNDGAIEVVALDPLALTLFLDHPEIVAVAKDGGSRLDKALASLSTTD